MKNKNNKLILLAISLAIFSVIISSILKLIGLNMFNADRIDYGNFGIILKNIIHFLFLWVQTYLIVGCSTHIKPNELFIKMIKFSPIILIGMLIPIQYLLITSFVVNLGIALMLKFRLRTIISFFINLLIIALIQNVLLWLKLDYKNVIQPFNNHIQFLLMNIDHIILMVGLYLFNLYKFGGE